MSNNAKSKSSDDRETGSGGSEATAEPMVFSDEEAQGLFESPMEFSDEEASQIFDPPMEFSEAEVRQGSSERITDTRDCSVGFNPSFSDGVKIVDGAVSALRTPPTSPLGAAYIAVKVLGVGITLAGSSFRVPPACADGGGRNLDGLPGERRNPLGP